VNKSSPLNAIKLWKGNIAVATLLTAILGLLCARGLASVSMIVFGLNAIWDKNPRLWLRQKWWLLIVLWFGVYVLSYFWTANTQEWLNHVQVKLPFLLLPLAFTLLPAWSKKQKEWFTWGLALLMLGAVVYGLWPLFNHFSYYLNSYKYAHVLPTAMYNDHISFSTAVACSIAWIGYFSATIASKWRSLGLRIVVIVLIVYLHVLAAKTGLVAFYIYLLGMAIAQFRRSAIKGLKVVLVAVVCGFTAYACFPTLRERIGYSFVTWMNFKTGERTGIYSDEARMISYKVGIKILSVHPVLGVGVGDVLDCMKLGYRQDFPKVQEAQMLWPHNQFLTTAVSVGLLGLVPMIGWLFWPLVRQKRSRAGLNFTLNFFILLVPLMVDVTFEVQAGVGVFLIFYLWNKKEMDDNVRPSLSSC